MVYDSKACTLRNRFDQRREFVAFEIAHLATGSTDEQMLVSAGGAQVHVTAALLVDALDQAKFLHFFQRSVDGDKAQAGIIPPAQVEYFYGAERALIGRHDLHDGAARTCNAIAALLQ